MDAYICVTCGTQYSPSREPPGACRICTDERQYVPTTGQSWTTLPLLQQTHKATFHSEGELIGIGTDEKIGIGQRALLVRSPSGNVLWDCISLVDETMAELVNGLGGLSAIAISHPHFYTSMVEWSRAFDGIPVYLHEADREWVMRDDVCLRFWQGHTNEILPGLTLIRCGGHFPGATVLHVPDLSRGNGAVLSGDTLQVLPASSHLGFMRSYPNYIPRGAAAVTKIDDRMASCQFEAIYGAFWGATILSDGRGVFERSIARHLKWLETDTSDI